MTPLPPAAELNALQKKVEGAFHRDSAFHGLPPAEETELPPPARRAFDALLHENPDAAPRAFKYPPGGTFLLYQLRQDNSEVAQLFSKNGENLCSATIQQGRFSWTPS